MAKAYVPADVSRRFRQACAYRDAKLRESRKIRGGYDIAIGFFDNGSDAGLSLFREYMNTPMMHFK